MLSEGIHCSHCPPSHTAEQSLDFQAVSINLLSQPQVHLTAAFEVFLRIYTHMELHIQSSYIQYRPCLDIYLAKQCWQQIKQQETIRSDREIKIIKLTNLQSGKQIYLLDIFRFTPKLPEIPGFQVYADSFPLAFNFHVKPKNPPNLYLT